MKLDVTFTELSNHLYLKIWDAQPHALIGEFLQIHVPWLNQIKGSEWRGYPDTKDEETMYDYTSCSLDLEQHPYFNADYYKSSLQLNLRKVKNETVGIVSVILWFYFNNKQSAEHGFEQLKEMFRSLHAEEKMIESKAGPVSIFVNPQEVQWPYEVQIALLKQETLDGHSYKIKFTQGSGI